MLLCSALDDWTDNNNHKPVGDWFAR